MDGETMQLLVERFSPLVPIDGYTEHVRTQELSYSVEFSGGAIEHFLAAERVPPAMAQLRIRKVDGTQQTLSVPRIDFNQYRLMQRDARAAVRNFSEGVRWHRIGNDAAYLAVDSFVNYRTPVKPKKLFKPIFRALEKEQRNTLILDLRNNGGGSNEPMAELLARLIEEPTQLTKDIRVRTIDFDAIRPHVSTWSQEALNPKPEWFTTNDDGSLSMRADFDGSYELLSPSKSGFRGRLIVLIGPNNSSGATLMIAKLKDLRRATLVGQPTGGSAEGPTAGILFFLKLPNSGVKLRLPVQRTYNAIERFEPGYGVQPDIAVTPTLSQWLAGEDPVLARAMQMLD